MHRLITALAAALLLALSLDAYAEDLAEAPPVEGAQAAPADEAGPAEGKARDEGDEVATLRAKVEALTKRVAELEEKLKSPAFAARRAARRGADVEALRKIELPDKPDKKQVRAYVGKILAVSARQNHFSNEDPQIGMLTQIGQENIDILLDLPEDTPANYYVRNAIEQLAGDESRKAIIDALAFKPQLIRMVLQHGWEADAKEVLVTELANRPRVLPPEWITAVVSLEDPTTYPALRDYFIHGSNRELTHRLIKGLPGINLKDAVDEAWKISRTRGQWEERMTAKIALAYGNVEALEVLIGVLNDEKQRNSLNDERGVVLRHVTERGTNAQLKTWFDTNRKELRFDFDSAKFYVPGAN